MAIWRVCAYALCQTHPNIPMISPLSPYKTPVKSPEVHQFICISIEKQFPRPPNAPPALHATSGSTSRQRQLGSQQIGDPMTSPNPEGDGKIWRISDVQSIKMGFCVQKWTMFGGSGIPNLTEMWTSVPSHLARSALEVLLISAELSLQNYATPNPSELTRNPANVHQNWWFETNQDLDKVEDN